MGVETLVLSPSELQAGLLAARTEVRGGFGGHARSVLRDAALFWVGQGKLLCLSQLAHESAQGLLAKD